MFKSKWTPNCFEFVNIKVIIKILFMKFFNFNFLFTMSKATKYSIVTFFNILKHGTIFCFISVWMIELFNFIMRKLAIFQTIINIAQIILNINSSFIVFRMIVHAFLRIMSCAFIRTNFSLEKL